MSDINDKDIIEFRQNFLEDVAVEANYSKSGTTSAFALNFSEILREFDQISGFDASFFSGSGKSNRGIRIDGYYLDSLDDSVSIYICEYSGEDKLEGINLSDSKKAFKKAKNFIEESIEYNLHKRINGGQVSHDFAYHINKKHSSIRRIKIILLTDKLMSSRIKTIEEEKYGDILIQYLIWDIGKLQKVAMSNEDIDFLSINLEEYMEGGLPCIEASKIKSKGINSYLCVMDGNAIADLYDKHGSRLLEGNVRSFLSLKRKVNKKIRETIITKPEMFFSYNNGISATASSIEFVDKTESRIKSIENLQIVNGGQTTAILSTTRYKDKVSLDNVYVQMKLTTVKSEESKIIIPEISRSSNNQNKVSEADFFSNSDFHVRMEQHSQRLIAPSRDGNQFGTHWFYERAAGQFTQKQLRLSKGEKTKFLLQNPKIQVVRKTDLAKYFNSWNRLPHYVSRGAQTNFILFANMIDKKWSADKDTFNQGFYKHIVVLAIIFKRTEKLVSSQEWYQNSYRANIVTYTIASLAYLLSKEYKDSKLDYISIWNKQELGEIKEKELIRLSRITYDHITDEKRPVVNVTQWCKKEACWDSMKTILDNMTLLKSSANFIKKNKEMKVEEKEFKKIQKIDNEFDKVNHIVTLGAEYWTEMYRWGKEANLLTSDEMKLLSSVTRLTATSLPKPSQCKKIISLEDRLKSNGFTF